MLEQRMTFIEAEVIPRLSTAVDRLTESLQKLVAIDERQTESRAAIERAFAEINQLELKCEALELRLRNVEMQMPVMNLIKSWVITGVVGGISLFLVAGAIIIFRLPH